jgi:hypothetical protein
VGLLAVLFVGWADNVKSYRSVFAEMKKVLPKEYNCMSSRDLSEPQRVAPLLRGRHHLSGGSTERRRSDCDLLLVQPSMKT